MTKPRNLRRQVAEQVLPEVLLAVCRHHWDLGQVLKAVPLHHVHRSHIASIGQHQHYCTTPLRPNALSTFSNQPQIALTTGYICTQSKNAADLDWRAFLDQPKLVHIHGMPGHELT